LRKRKRRRSRVEADEQDDVAGGAFRFVFRGQTDLAGFVVHCRGDPHDVHHHRPLLGQDVVGDLFLLDEDGFDRKWQGSHERRRQAGETLGNGSAESIDGARVFQLLRILRLVRPLLFINASELECIDREVTGQAVDVSVRSSQQRGVERSSFAKSVRQRFGQVDLLAGIFVNQKFHQRRGGEGAARVAVCPIFDRRKVRAEINRFVGRLGRIRFGDES